MSNLWQLRWRRWKVERLYRKTQQELVKTKASRNAIAQAENEGLWEISRVAEEIDRGVGWRLFDEARSLDVETPPLKEAEMWIVEEGSNRVWLSPKGRAHVRRLIDEEKSRRFEVKTRWVTKIILPLIVSLVGLIGALTGLVAILLRNK